MKITLNGNATELPEGTTLASLLEARQLAATRVAVELNGEVVRRERHAASALSEGDVVELVTFVGGG